MKLEQQTYKRKVEVRLADAELINLADQMATTDVSIREATDEKKKIATKFTTQLKELRGVMKSLGEKIAKRTEEREVEVVATPIFERHCVEIRLASDGSLIEERPFREEEQKAAMQQDLPGVDRGEPLDLSEGDEHAVDNVLPFPDGTEDVDAERPVEAEPPADGTPVTGGVIVEPATPVHCSTCGAWTPPTDGAATSEGLCQQKGGHHDGNGTVAGFHCDSWCPVPGSASAVFPCSACACCHPDQVENPIKGTCANRGGADVHLDGTCENWVARPERPADAAPTPEPLPPPIAPRCRSRFAGRRCELETGHAGPCYAQGQTWEKKHKKGTAEQPAAE